MKIKRVLEHPVLDIAEKKQIPFSFKGNPLECFEGEVISTALIANDIHVFGHHPKDGSSQGIFCANGQCSQCTVIANSKPVKGCMTKVEPGMTIEPLDGLPELPSEAEPVEEANMHPIRVIKTDVLILGGGPSGLSAARTLSDAGVRDIILIDDKDHLGGKLVLQTHKFFGSQEDCYAGTRGITIAKILEEAVKESNAKIWLNSTAVAVFSDQKVGILKDGNDYVLVEPRKLLVATGAREKNLTFPGNTLTGVYGAGAFQTLVNRDLVKPCDDLFIVGGGNVGLIAGYHALQAGIRVTGLVEALPKCGGYKVHEDKLRRSGVPIYTGHTILAANGEDRVSSITISEIDRNFRPIKGTERSFICDTVLIAVGLDPVDEFYHKAREFGMEVWAAGDAQEIAEASAAMFSGRIEALKIAKSLDLSTIEIPREWLDLLTVLKKPGGSIHMKSPLSAEEGVFPVFHCYQKIPCNPCTAVCPVEQINTVDNRISYLPYFKAEEECIACGRCAAVCPGLAITLVDYRKDKNEPIVTLPYEMDTDKLAKGDTIGVMGEGGEVIGNCEIVKIRKMKKYPGTRLVSVKMPKKLAKKAAGIAIQEISTIQETETIKSSIPNEAIICRCERINAGEIRKWIKRGVKDVNEIKTITRAGMGACGAKTCASLIERLFREENIPLKDVTVGTTRPLFVEVPLGMLAGNKEEKE